MVKRGTVTTARYNFQNLPIEKLYVRFFKYDVAQSTQNHLHIKEQYLDLSIIKINNAKGGLDAGWVRFAEPILSNLLNRYAKILPIRRTEEPLDSGLPAGRYAMFH